MKLSAAKSATKYTSLLFVSLTFMLGLSLTGNIFAWLRLDDLLNSRQETYIPMFFDTPFTLTRSHADANYLESVAQSLIYLRYNVSPESVKANHQSLLRYVAKESRPEMQDVLSVEAKEVIGNNVTSAFYLSKMEVYPVDGIVDIQGELKTWIGKREALPEFKKVRLHVKYQNGITEVISFEDIIDENKP
ncbi:TPA: type IV conjugative transfer system protein TraE [Providencia alcalifaciens]